MKKILLILIFATLHLLGGVKVEGLGYISSSKENAKNMAILDAKIKAVEKEIGVLVKSQTKMENFEIKYDVVEQKIEGYVSSYNIINESVEGNIYKVTIDADVKKGKISMELDYLTQVLASKKNPKFLIVTSGDGMVGSVFESELKKYFLKNKIDVVDLESVNPYYKELLSGIGTEALKTNSSKRVGADYIVNLNIQRQNLDTQYKGETHKSVTLHVDANAINISNNKILVSKTYPSRASENKIIVQSALIMEAGHIAENFAREFMIELIDQFKDAAYNGDNLTVEINNIKSYAQAAQLAEYLQMIVFNSKVYLKQFNANSATYDVTVQGGIDKMLDDMIMNNDQYIFEITNKSNNNCQINLK
ncbi:MAG: hypothetical protein IE909_08085 [Campylobacterales bacterium]|nr:hypothetical protein [Campylobacterales bacterium]